MKYNKTTLVEYCNENDIQLMHDYTNISVNRESHIDGKCINDNCCNNFNKNFRQLVKTGAYCNICMVKISNTKIRDSNVKYDINILTDFCNENNILLTEDYSSQFINRDSEIQGICLNNECQNIFNKRFRELLKINGYCKDCSKENGKNKNLKTNLERYGVDNPMKNEDFKEKLKQTMIKKYGVEHNSQSEEIKLKKINTYIKHFGVTSHLKCPLIRQQIIQTNLLKFGVKNPQQNTEIKEKTITTNLKKYGVKYYSQTEEFKNKVIKTNLERYGVPHHSQNAEVAETMFKSSYNKKQYELPSGKTIEYQGYENFAFDYLLFSEKICENDIIINRTDVPEIWYNDKNGKRRRHYVDIYIKLQNKCVEVKSMWTNQQKNNVLEKQQAAKDLGYNYEVWIFDKKGDILDKYI